MKKQNSDMRIKELHEAGIMELSDVAEICEVAAILREEGNVPEVDFYDHLQTTVLPIYKEWKKGVLEGTYTGELGKSIPGIDRTDK